jgi:hypothetical protein
MLAKEYNVSQEIHHCQPKKVEKIDEKWNKNDLVILLLT